MDPASAIGVAAAAVQFFAIGAQAIRLAKQISSSDSGTTAANEALKASLEHLQEIRRDLRPGIVIDNNSKIAQTQTTCSQLSDKLLTQLEGIRASSQPTKSRFSRNALAVWHSIRASRKIKKMETELKVAQSHFSEALTVDMRNAIENVLEQQGKDTSRLHMMWDEVRKLRPELQQMRTENKAATSSTLKSLARVEQTAQVRHASDQDHHQTSHKLIESVDANVHARFSDLRVIGLQREILDSLHFDDMLTRQQHILPPTKGTFEWVFTGKSPHQEKRDLHGDTLDVDSERRCRLRRWFVNDEPLFWINGKPGSGKSSLMSHIANDDRTVRALEAWSNRRPVHIIKFFFWRPGSALQRNVSGLLRSLLYQLFIINSDEINRLVAEGTLPLHPSWEQVELLRAIESILTSYKREHLCFFIDGLDEHDGDYMSLLDLILQTQSASNVKICISSRPEPAFCNRLHDCPSLSMQDLNGADIRILVQQKLEPYGNAVSSLIGEVTWRAEGVVFWAALVCDSLVRGHTMYDDQERLEKRLLETPSGLKELFEHMFSKIDNVHRENLRLYCHILKWKSEGATGRMTSISGITAILQHHDVRDLDHFLEKCKLCERQISTQSQGLIEVTNYPFKIAGGPIDAWSPRQVTETGFIQSSSDTMRNLRVIDYENRTIQWVHRSAHDCIFGEPGETIAPWIIATGDSELRKKTLRGLRWLGEHSTVLWAEKDVVDDHLSLYNGMRGLVQDIIYLADQDCQAYQILSQLQNVLKASLSGNKRDHRRREMQNIGVVAQGVSIELQPLLMFWEGISLNRVAESLDLLNDNPFAAPICGGLIGQYEAASHMYTNTLMSKMLDRMFQYLQPWTDQVTISAEFLHRRRFGFRETITPNSKNLVRYNRIVLSWLGTGDRDEADVMHGLAKFTQILGCDDKEREYLSRATTLLKARDPWQGLQAVDSHRSLLPLQLLLPHQAFIHWQQSSTDSSPFRLICNHRRSRVVVSSTLQSQISHAPDDIVAIYDLTAFATRTLLSQRVQWTELPTHNNNIGAYPSLCMTWIGTAHKFDQCFQAVLDDIWADVGQQLDAWQQLYTLACVKFCLKRMWTF